jgi:hypothetical protein
VADCGARNGCSITSGVTRVPRHDVDAAGEKALHRLHIAIFDSFEKAVGLVDVRGERADSDQNDYGESKDRPKRLRHIGLLVSMCGKITRNVDSRYCARMTRPSKTRNPKENNMVRIRRSWTTAFILLAAASISAAEVKKPIRGLVSMGAFKFESTGTDPVNTLEPLNAKPGIFGGIVILATWRELQRAASSGLEENNTIDKALEEVRAYNRRNPQKPLGVKLRVWGGYVAPDWAKEIGGPPIHVNHKKPRTLGRFWSPAYRKAWAHLQELLAAKYDNEPLIREVAVTSCMSFTAEPFYLADEPRVSKPLNAAGFKPFQFKQCLLNAVYDYAPWKTTNIEIPLNPVYMPLGNPKGDPVFTEQVMRACRKSIGKRCIFDNHDLDIKPPKTMIPIYNSMKKLGPPTEFQTFHETPPDFEGTIQKAVSLGAGSVELWQDYEGFPLQPDDKLRKWAAMIERNTKE